MEPKSLQHRQNKPSEVLARSARMQLAQLQEQQQADKRNSSIPCCWREVVRLCKNVDRHSSHQAEAACLQRGPARRSFIKHIVAPVLTASPSFETQVIGDFQRQRHALS